MMPRALMFRALMFCVLSCGLAGPVRAGDLILADPWEIIHLVREIGPAEVGRDAMSEPRIDASLDATPYSVNFYGCYLGRDCTAILLQSRLDKLEWHEDPLDKDLMVEWNRRKLVGKAYLDSENRAVLEHAVVLEHGVPHNTLRAALEAWRLALAEYTDHLDF